MSLQIGQILDDKYRILRELGSGSMGAVYEGENIRIKRRVAIKVLLGAVARRADVVKRFEREAQAAGRIGSEHIVEVLDLGTLPDGSFFMVMEFLEGMTLGEHIRQKGRLTPREVAPIAQQILTGLEMAHEARVIHRDLKPDNIFLVKEHAGQKNFVKILDFGVSKFNPLNAEDGMSMTRTGAVVGTPFYMAPEQAKGSRDIDHRSDLYSMGVILYEAITGQKPFHAGTFNELIFKIVLETPPPPEQYVPDLDRAFSGIIRRAIAREPDERYQHADAFRNALYVWLHTGRDDSAAEPLPPPPGNFDIDAAGATMVMHDAASMIPTADPAAAVFATGAEGLLPPSVRPGGSDTTGLPAVTPIAAAADLRLASASPSATTSPTGTQLPDAPLPDAPLPDAPQWVAAGVPMRNHNKMVVAVIVAGGVLLAAGGAIMVLYDPGPAAPGRAPAPALAATPPSGASDVHAPPPYASTTSAAALDLDDPQETSPSAHAAAPTATSISTSTATLRPAPTPMARPSAPALVATSRPVWTPPAAPRRTPSKTAPSKTAPSNTAPRPTPKSNSGRQIKDEL